MPNILHFSLERKNDSPVFCRRLKRNLKGRKGREAGGKKLGEEKTCTMNSPFSFFDHMIYSHNPLFRMLKT
jgi:hypothetical protein